MLNIKEIAPKLTQKLSIAINDDEAVEFAEALIAEVQKQNNPIAWWNGKETAFFEHETDGPVGEVKIPLYTFPPIHDPQWKSIESAPKDGRELILLLTPSNWPQVAYSNTWWQGGFSVENKPTHWMPLPTLPKRSMEGV